MRGSVGGPQLSRRWGQAARLGLAGLFLLAAYWAVSQGRAQRREAGDVVSYGAGAMVAGEATPDPEGLRGSLVVPERPAPDFTLTDHRGHPFTLSSAAGKVSLVFFGYTYCPDVCPMTLGKLRGALEEMGKAAAGVQVLLVSVDPERDTPEVLGRYLAGYDMGAIGLTGDLAEVQAVADAYGVTFFKELPEGESQDTEDYTMAHSARVFVVDGFGQLRETFTGPFAPADVAHDLAALVETTGSTLLLATPGGG